MTRSLMRLVTLLLSLALVAAACGDDDGGTTTSGDADVTSTAPETGDPADASDDESTPDVAIVSLSPTATEMLFAIDAGDVVVAVDDQSNFPDEAPTTDLSGFTPNAEAIAGYEPTHVVISGDFTGDLTPALEALDIAVVVQLAAVSLDDTYAQIEELGALTGRTDEAAAVVEQMRQDIDELTARVPERDDPLTYFYELDDTYYSVTSDTFVGTILGLAGLRSIGDGVDDDAFGFPQLSEEYIIDSDPDVVILADTKCCGQSTETVAARAGWDSMTAVAAGNVIELDDDIASRWGPRVVDLLESIVGATADL